MIFSCDCVVVGLMRLLVLLFDWPFCECWSCVGRVLLMVLAGGGLVDGRETMAGVQREGDGPECP